MNNARLLGRTPQPAREAAAAAERAVLTRVECEAPHPTAAPEAPKLAGRPVTVCRGSVGRVRNTGDKYVRPATYTNATTGQATSVVVEVGPNATAEPGRVEGARRPPGTF